jgi:predicted ArsR family transcriptional regulator
VLRDTLRLVASGEVASNGDLAKRLGITPALAEQILEELVKGDYLRSARSGCNRGCEGCPAARDCAGLPEVLTLTDRGRAALAR